MPVQPKSLNFVHLSDIHFVRGLSGESAYDLDEIVRNEVKRDAEKVRPLLEGEVNGILVTGDIAFAGKTPEYVLALKWLAELADELRCDREYVWCVPGNHDVDQADVKRYTAIPLVHADLHGAGDKLDDRLRYHLENENTGPLLLAPLQNYNEQFAAKFGCITSPRKLWWEDDFILNDGSTLTLRGLNSVLISGPEDDRDTAKMLVGSAQTEFLRRDGVEYLTLCHHPPDWLVDGDNTREALCAYSRIQLFGHKHAQRVEQVNQTLWICAGAVHPVRTERNWIPRYNYLSLRVTGTGPERQLVVDVFSRVWSRAERRFVRESLSDDGGAQRFSLRIGDWKGGETMGQAAAFSDEGRSPRVDRPEEGQMRLNRKKLLYRFLGLSYHRRISLMRRFKLIEPGEEKLPDIDLFAGCFERARTKNVLDAFWDAVEAETNVK